MKTHNLFICHSWSCRNGHQRVADLLAGEIRSCQIKLQDIRDRDPRGQTADGILAEVQGVYASAYQKLSPTIAHMMQATQCIFSHRPSGFSQPDEDGTAQAQVMGLTSQVLSKTKDGG